DVGELGAEAATVRNGRLAEVDPLVVQDLDGLGAVAVGLDADGVEVAREWLLEPELPCPERLLERALGDLPAAPRLVVDDEHALAAADGRGVVAAALRPLPGAGPVDLAERLG